MLLYTIKQSNVLNNPTMFFLQAQSVYTSALAGLLPAGQSPKMPPISFESSSIDIENGINFESSGVAQNNFSEFKNNDYSLEFLNVGVAGFGNNKAIGNIGRENREFGNELKNPHAALDLSFIQQFLATFDITFAYSLFLGWIGLACAIFACIFGCMGVICMMRRTTDYDQSIPMK